MSISPELKQKLDGLVGSDAVVLFMKGNKSFPQCGFSATVIQVLNSHISQYTTVNVLSDPAIRDGIKAYSDWPTIPQLYIKGEFVGGCDIVKELHASGELAKMLDGAGVAPATPLVSLGGKRPAGPAPTVVITAPAAAVLKEALSDAEPGDVVHLTIDAKFDHNLDVGPREPGAMSLTIDGIVVEIDGASLPRANGVKIDYIDSPAGSGFKIENPNRPTAVKQTSPKELKALLDSGKIKEFFDVRTEQERTIATLGAKLLDDKAMAYIETLPKDTPLAFHCHHGGRSNNAANMFASKGFTNVHNMAGGIEAWSKDVDSSIARY